MAATAERFGVRLMRYHAVERPDHHRYALWNVARDQEIWSETEISARDVLEVLVA